MSNKEYLTFHGGFKIPIQPTGTNSFRYKNLTDAPLSVDWVE